MSFKLIRKDYWIADSVSDLDNVPEKDMGASCYIINGAAEYKLTSDGNWVKQVPPTSGATEGGNVDLTGYATETYVDDAIANIEYPVTDLSNYATVDQIPDVSGFAKIEDIPNLDGYAMTVEVEAVKANPMLKAFDLTRNPLREDGQAIFLAADDPQTLQEVLQEKGLGVYNVWVQKGHVDLPNTMITDNTSGRGFACVDFQSNTAPEKFIGYVVLFDKKDNMYYRFFNKGTAGKWMKVSAVEA